MLLFNAKFLIQPLTGVQRVAYTVTKHMLRLRTSDCLFIAPKGYINQEYNLSPEFKANLKQGFLTGQLWEQLELPLLAKKRRAIILNLGNSGPILYQKNVTMVHDLLWLRYREFYPRTFVAWYRFMIPKLLRNSLKVLTVSENSQKDLIEYFSLPKEKIHVVYPGADRHIFNCLNLNREHFILWVGSLRYYKNLHGLIMAFTILKKRFKLPHKLVLVCHGATKLRQTLPDILREEIIAIDGATDEKLAELYNRALLFVFPSLYEGFGLPPLEAMACGCPVVAGRVGSLPEVGGNAVLYCDPSNPEDIAEKIYTILSSKDLWDELSKKGLERAKLFSWEKTAEEILKILDSLA